MSKKEMVQWLRPEPGVMEAGPSIKLVKVRPHVPVVGFFLSDYVHCVVTHWVAGRTKPCLGLQNGCESCRFGIEKRPKGYIAVALDHSGIVKLLEITEKAFDTNLELSATDGLRGLYFTASRNGSQNNSPLVVEINRAKKPAQPLVDDIDVKEVLCRIWFGKEKHRGTKGVDIG